MNIYLLFITENTIICTCMYEDLNDIYKIMLVQWILIKRT